VPIEIIRTNILSIAKTITDIGNVYDQMPHVTTWSGVFEKFKSDDKLKVLFFTKISSQPDDPYENFNAANYEQKWFFKYIHSSNVDNESDKAFDNICESIINTFNSSKRLNGTVRKILPMAQQNKGYVMVCNMLCHYAEFELKTF